MTWPRALGTRPALDEPSGRRARLVLGELNGLSLRIG